MDRQGDGIRAALTGLTFVCRTKGSHKATYVTI